MQSSIKALLLVPLLLLLLSVACSKKAKGEEILDQKCDKAFDHMKEVSLKELETLPPAQKAMVEKIAAKTSKNDGERRTKFVAACDAGKIDVACIMKAEDTMAYIGCLSSKAKRE